MDDWHGAGEVRSHRRRSRNCEERTPEPRPHDCFRRPREFFGSRARNNGERRIGVPDAHPPVLAQRQDVPRESRAGAPDWRCGLASRARFRPRSSHRAPDDQVRDQPENWPAVPEGSTGKSSAVLQWPTRLYHRPVLASSNDVHVLDTRRVAASGRLLRQRLYVDALTGCEWHRLQLHIGTTPDSLRLERRLQSRSLWTRQGHRTS